MTNTNILPIIINIILLDCGCKSFYSCSHERDEVEAAIIDFDRLFSTEMQETKKCSETKRDTNTEEGPKTLGLGPNPRSSTLYN